MNDTPPAADALIEIRKYPNRRYYDTSRSRHLTLEEIRGLIRDGHNVRIVDSETSADITGRVLTQIILELDTPKLEFFPVPLLQQVIRVNDQMVKGYLDRFLRQSSEGFAVFLKQLEDPLRGGALFPPPFGAFTTPWVKPAAQPAAEPVATAPAPAEAGLAGSVEALRQEVAALQQRLGRARRTGPAREGRRGGSGRSRPGSVARGGAAGRRRGKPAARRQRRVVRTQK